MLGNAVEDGEGLVEGGGVDQRNAELLEVEEPFEIAAVVFAHLEHGGVFALEFDGSQEVSAADLDAFLYTDGALVLAPHQALGLLEHPGVADGAAADEYAVDAVSLPCLHGLLGGDDVAVAEDGDVHAGVVLHLADEGPVGVALIHLGLGAAMDAEGCDAHVLQPLGQFDDGFVVGVVAQACLDGDGEVGATDDGLGDMQHFGQVLEDAAAGPFAGHLADGAAPVDVDEVGLLGFHNVDTSHQFLLVGPEDLYAYGVLRGGETHLAIALFGLAVEGFGGDELGDEQVGPEVFAQLAEGEVGNVVHGRKSKDTIFSYV